MAGREGEVEAREGFTHREVQEARRRGCEGVLRSPSSDSSEPLCYPLQAPLSSLVKRAPEPVSKGSYGGGVCVQIRHRAWYVGNT